MSNKQTTIIIVAVALMGGVLGALVMRYVAPAASTATAARDEPQHEQRARTQGHQDGETHAQHDEPADHGKQELIRLSEAERREFGIEVGQASPGTLQIHVTLPGEVGLNTDRRAHIVPRVSGVVWQVNKTLGDQVLARDVMAVLESRDLADLKSTYLAARERVTLASTTFHRETELRQQKITSEQEYLEAKQALAEAQIEQRAAGQKLHALGFSDEYLAQLPKHPPDATFTQYAITEPFDGSVIEKHITLGDMLKDDSAAFVVAHFSSVWVDLRVYQKDLPFVQPGQPVVISAGQGIPDAQGAIFYVGPLVGEQTRTALARVVLPNPDGRWRPGLFITGEIVVDDVVVPLLVPKTALQTIEERPTLFVQTAEGMQPQPVTLGRRNNTHVEITAGLAPGQWYVTSGAFTLKAQLSKGAFGDGHGH